MKTKKNKMWKEKCLERGMNNDKQKKGRRKEGTKNERKSRNEEIGCEKKGKNEKRK